MHRMRRFVALLGLSLALTAALPARRAVADLIRPAAGRSYPDVAADVNGVVNYTYDPASRTGTFHVRNTPYLLAAGPTVKDEYDVLRGSDGNRTQVVNVALDANGKILDRPTNSYELYGTIVAQGQTYSGLLLKGVPTAFGSQLGQPGIQGTSIFDLNLKVTGGQLASYFGHDAYMRIMPELQDTFNGSFQTDFSAAKATSNTRSYQAQYPFPSPAPEPTTLALLLACCVGFAKLRKRQGA